MSQDIPQIISIAAVTRDFKISIKKEVRRYLGATRSPLYLLDGKELLLTRTRSPKAKPAESGPEKGTFYFFLNRVSTSLS